MNSDTSYPVSYWKVLSTLDLHCHCLYVLPLRSGGVCVSKVEILEFRNHPDGLVCKCLFLHNYLDESGNGIYKYLCDKKLAEFCSARFLVRLSQEDTD